MPVEARISRDVLAADVLFLVKCIRDCVQEKQSTRLIEMRNAFAPSVTLEFGDYVRFLRHFAYVTVDARQSLSLTAAGTKLATVETSEELDGRLEAFFTDALRNGYVERETEDETRAALELFESELTPPNGKDIRRSTVPPATIPPRASGSASAGPYLLGEPIGHGPLGRVVRARHGTLPFEVAVKEIANAAALPALKNEVMAQAKLRHPAVVQILHVELNGTALIAEELCEGGNLRTWLNRTRPTPQRILRGFVQLLDGLALADSEGLSHGDIKPENVLFDRFGNAKLSDFGHARLAGTPTGQNPREDLLMLGILLYGSLTGRPHGPTAPFASKIVPAVPAAMNWVIERMTAEDPSERYTDPAQAREAMLAALADPAFGGAGVIPVSTMAWSG